MRNGFIRFVAVLFFAVAPVPGAAEDVRLPADVAAHVSLASPKGVLDGVFTYVDAATKGTGNYMPAELLGMIALAYIPVPMDVWDSEKELHAVFLDGADLHTMLLVFSHGGFGSFLEGLAEADWEVPEKALDNDEETLFTEVRMLALPGGTPIFAADLGDGRAVLAEDIEAARRILGPEGLTLEHDSEADLVVRARLGAEEGEVGEMMLKAIAEDAQDIIGTIAEAGLTEAAGRWLTDAAAKHAETLGAEIEKAEELRVELGFNGENLALGVSVRSGGGSWAREWAETMRAAAAFPETDLAKYLPEGFFSVNAGAEITKLVPGAEAIAEALFADFAEFAPEHRDIVAGYIKKVFAAGPGMTATANYLNGGKPYQLAVTEFADPEAELAATAELTGALNEAAAKAFANPAEGVSFPVEKREADGFAWREWRMEPADAARFAAFLGRVNAMGETDFAYAPDFRFHMAALPEKGLLVTLAGEAGADVFAAALKRIAETGADASSLFDAPETKASAERLGAAQLSLVLVRPEGLPLLFTLANADAEPDEKRAESMRGVAARLMAEEKPADAGAVAVGGLGAEGGSVAFRVVIPAAAAKALFIMQERYAGLMVEEDLAAARARAEARESGEAAGDESGAEGEGE